MQLEELVQKEVQILLVPVALSTEEMVETEVQMAAVLVSVVMGAQV